jgi:7-cyano-7-deazaguanine reductase
VRLDSLDKSLDERFDVRPAGYCIDDMDVEIDCYQVTRDFLKTGGERISERLYSNLLRSRCPVTGQPDWATVSVTYTGRAIDRQGLLRYLVSYRNHQGFHEQLIEQIFCDIQHVCQPESLTVYGRFTRRGGIDINPWRSSEEGWAPNWLEARQ